jgi:N utilization substance protein B
VPRRRGARKLALDVLYENEVNGRPIDEILSRHSGNRASEYATLLINGVRDHKAELDSLIETHAEDWALERMPLIDLSLLRLGLFELLYAPDVPAAVTIDELVELAKTYSTEDSGRFINGVLSRIHGAHRETDSQDLPDRKTDD